VKEAGLDLESENLSLFPVLFIFCKDLFLILSPSIYASLLLSFLD